MESLGACIRKIRKEKQLKVYELADKVGITPEFVTLIEKSHRYPSEKVLNKFIKTLGFDLRPIYYSEKHPDIMALMKNKAFVAEIKRVTGSTK